MQRYYVFFLALLWTSQAFGIHLAPSHIVILQADTETIFGSYYVAVQNPGEREEPFSFKLRLPLETIDFQAAEGLTNENISILSEGSLQVHQVYKPGMSLQGINFKVPARRNSDSVMTLSPLEDIPALYITSPQGASLHLSAKGFEQGVPPMLAGGQYYGIHAEHIQASSSISIEISGIPGGRRPFYLMGLCMSLVLFLVVSLLTLRSQRLEEEIT